MDDRRPDLALDVVADDRQAGILEALVPVVLAGDEDRQAVDEADAGGERLLDVPLGRLLGADRQVTDEDVGLGLLEDADHVRGFARGFGDLLFQVLAEAVVGHAAVDGDAHVGDVGELDRVVLPRPDRLAEVFADLLGVDVEGGDELDVADVVAAEVDVHQARHFLAGVRVLVVLDALDEAVGAVADADDRDADLLVRAAGAVGVAVCSVLTHEFRSPPGLRWVAEDTWRLRWLHVPSGAAVVVLDAGDLAGKLVPHMQYPLESREYRQSGNCVDGRRKQFEVADASALGEDQADRKYHHADRPGGQTDLAFDPQRLGPGAGVGDHQRKEHGDHAHRGGDVVALDGEVAGDGGEHDPLLDPVQGRVEEGAEHGPLARHPRVAAVERVHDRAEHEGDAGEEEEALGDQRGGDQVAEQPDHRDCVRSQARLDQAVASVGAELLPVAGTGTVAAPRGRGGSHSSSGYYASASCGAGARPTGRKAQASGRAWASRWATSAAQSATIQPRAASTQ